MLYLDIFNKDYIQRTPSGGITHSRDIDYLRRTFVFNKDAIEGYYQGRNFSVKNTNLISRMLEHFSLYLASDVYRYLESCEGRLTYLAKHFKLTSDIEKGVLHPPYFFGNMGDEVVFSGFENFDAITVAKNWKSEPCITTLYHPRNDSKFLLPLGKDDGCRSGVSSVFIDMARLAVKYREFVKENQGRGDDQVLLNKNHFVMKYVLPPMVMDVTDHTLLNRVMDCFYTRPVVEPRFKHAFKLMEPNTQLDRYTQNTLDMITSKSMDFVQMLRHIRLVFKKDASELLCLPEFYGNRNVLPGLLLSRIDHMVFLLEACKNKDTSRKYINDWKNLAQRVLSDNSLSKFLTYDLEVQTKEKLRRIKEA